MKILKMRTIHSCRLHHPHPRLHPRLHHPHRPHPRHPRHPRHHRHHRHPCQHQLQLAEYKML
jgi:hypothetical protein